MLDFDTVLELMKKYGYSSTSIHPYIYQNGDNIGICYTYIDEEYGLLERIKIFENIEAFEEFLKEQSWLKSNGKNYNVRMILDNYESSMPKVLYLRNEKVMVEGEMADIDNFDLRESQRKQMDEVSQILYEAGDLLLVYDEIKERQLQYLQKIIELKNVLRGKYFDLQEEVDAYNNYKVERNLTLIPDVLDKGSINEVLEVTIKDQYNMYIANRPSLEEIKDFIKQVWELNLNLELNTKYYEAQKEENDIRNEIKVVDKKLELMNSLKEELKPLFGIDLIGRFKKINDECRKESKYMSKNYVEEHLALVNKKYSVFDKLNLLYASDYLREAIQNTNYDDLAIKYSATAKDEDINKAKLPLNEVVADLAIQYRDKLSIDEQSILVLYNNSKYAKLFDRILEMDNFDTIPIKNVIKGLSSIKGLSKLKTECYENVKKRIDDPLNEKIKNSLFSNVDFTTFETFIASLIKKLATLKNVNSKMTIKSDFNMYTLVNKGENIPGRKYVSVTNDLNTLLNEAKENRCMIGICLLKEGLPVLYSPYYFDLGDMYSKGASPLMEIKEMVNFDLLIEVADTTIFVGENKVEVARYYTEPKMNENISYVDDIKLAYSTTFCKYSFVSNLPVYSEVVVPSNDVAVAPVVNNPEEVEVKQESDVVSEIKPKETPIVNEVSETPKVETPLEEPIEESSQPVVQVTEVVNEPIPVVENQNETTPVVEEPKIENVEEPVKDLVVESQVEEPVAESTEQPAEQDASEVTEQPVEQKAPEVAEQPVAQVGETVNEQASVTENKSETTPVVEESITVNVEQLAEDQSVITETTEETSQQETEVPVEEQLVIEGQPLIEEKSQEIVMNNDELKEEPTLEDSEPTPEETPSESVVEEQFVVEPVKSSVDELEKITEENTSVVESSTDSAQPVAQATEVVNESAPVVENKSKTTPVVEEATTEKVEKQNEPQVDVPVEEQHVPVQEPQPMIKQEVSPIVTKEEVKEEQPVITENKTEVVANKEVSPIEEIVKNDTTISEQKEPSTAPIIEEKKEEIKSVPIEDKTPEQTIEKPMTIENISPVIEEEKEEILSSSKTEEVQKDVTKPVNENKIFATFETSQSTSNEVKNETKQEVVAEDFKTVTNNTEVIKEPLSPNQKKVKIVKKVSSVGTSTVNNNEAFSKEVSTPTPTTHKKNIVVKSVGSIGKPLTNRGDVK